jgi:hypothetical protein
MERFPAVDNVTEAHFRPRADPPTLNVRANTDLPQAPSFNAH